MVARGGDRAGLSTDEQPAGRCAPGERLLSVRLAEGTSTEDVLVRNLPYNLFDAVALHGWPSAAEGQWEVGLTVAGLRLQVTMRQPESTPLVID